MTSTSSEESLSTESFEPTSKPGTKFLLALRLLSITWNNTRFYRHYKNDVYCLIECEDDDEMLRTNTSGDWKYCATLRIFEQPGKGYCALDQDGGQLCKYSCGHCNKSDEGNFL